MEIKEWWSKFLDRFLQHCTEFSPNYITAEENCQAAMKARLSIKTTKSRIKETYYFWGNWTR